MTEVDKWICTWDDIDEMVEKLLREMKRRKYKPDFIVGISRGGLVPAIMLSHHFNVPMLPVVWSTRDFIGEDRERVDSIHHLVMDEEKNVLIVDDICDTGTTFQSMSDYLTQEGCTFPMGVEFASLYVRYTAEFDPDFWAVEVPDESWIVFPFEVEPQNHALD
jgi:hypoxanthine phosphoribosyltransferase